jgi:predicted RNA-binding Zn ribbon-like protein
MERNALELVRDFVNTYDVEEDRDEIEQWLADGGFDVTLREAVRVREAIRELLLANNGLPADVDGATRVLDAAARRAGLVVRFAAGRMRIVADGGLGVVLGALAEAMSSRDWPRLKACRADTCHWVFVDHAKNRSRTWCSMSVCGNRRKAQRFRERHAAA